MKDSAPCVSSVMASLVATDDVSRHCPFLRRKIYICVEELLIDTCFPDLHKGGLAFALPESCMH